MAQNQIPNYSLEHIKTNEEIAKKFFDIEVSILSTSNFKDFFEKLLLLIEEKFGIPHIWISIINGSEVSHIIEALESSDLLKKRLNLVGRNTFLKLIKDEKTPVLVNDVLKPYYKLLPMKRKYLVKSLAIAPLILEGKVIGSLNLGDYSKSRFQPDMDIFFLSQIAVKISICLSNITAREKLKQLATRDSLTGLFNRRGMEDLLEREFSRGRRYDTPLALLFIDCDNFKMVNDSYGHNCGDKLLQHIAYQMIEMTRKEDVVSRFDGDEFVIILPNQTSEEALMVMERFQILLKKCPMKYGNIIIPVSISFGIASAEDSNVKNPASLLKKADKRLYDAKKQKCPGVLIKEHL
jgi:diguanylate cyclase (GGDEF)-like protein